MNTSNKIGKNNISLRAIRTALMSVQKQDLNRSFFYSVENFIGLKEHTTTRISLEAYQTKINKQKNCKYEGNNSREWSMHQIKFVMNKMILSSYLENIFAIKNVEILENKVLFN